MSDGKKFMLGGGVQKSRDEILLAMNKLTPENSLASLTPSPWQEHNLGMQMLVEDGHKIVSYELRTGYSSPSLEICEVYYVDGNTNEIMRKDFYSKTLPTVTKTKQSNV